MELMWGMVGFFIFVTIIFVLIAIVFPEWVGITGKKAMEIQKHQQQVENENKVDAPLVDLVKPEQKT